MFVNKHFAYLKDFPIPQGGGTMQNLYYTIFYMKTNILQEFHIYNTVLLI